MAKAKFDPNAAFKNIVGVRDDDTDDSTKKRENEDGNTRKRAGAKLVQKAYYITEAQYKALKLRAAIEDDKDMSAIVREALDAYLGNQTQE